MRDTLDGCRGHMGWDDERVIEILLDYIEEIHWGWGKHDPDSHLKSYMAWAITEELNPATKCQVESREDEESYSFWLGGILLRGG